MLRYNFENFKLVLLCQGRLPTALSHNLIVFVQISLKLIPDLFWDSLGLKFLFLGIATRQKC